jgi:hypothetical protein
MKIVIEQVDGNYYADVILDREEIDKIDENLTLEGETIFKRRKVYVGVRLRGVWDYDEDEETFE